MDDLQLRLHGQVSVVTGGAGGIGAAICRRLAASGANRSGGLQQSGRGGHAITCPAGSGIPRGQLPSRRL